MPTVYGQLTMPDVAIDDSMAGTPEALAALLKPKNQPVKPWSLPRRAADALESDSAELPNPLFKLLNGLSSQGDESNECQGNDVLAERLDIPFLREERENKLSVPADPSALVDSDDPEFVTRLMQLIFPDTAGQEAYTATDAVQEPVFDLSPCVETEPAHANVMLPVEVSKQHEFASPERSTAWTAAPLETNEAREQQAAVPPSASTITPTPATALPDERSNDRSTNLLWDDLSALIEPSGTVDKTTSAPAVDAEARHGLPDATAVSALDSVGAVPIEHRSPNVVTPDHAGIPPMFTASAGEPNLLENATDADNETDMTTKPIAAWTWLDRLEKASQPRSVVSKKADVEQTAQSPAKLVALSTISLQATVNQQSVSQPSVGQQSVDQQVGSVASHTEPAPAPFSTGAPSPIVYPLRTSKKLASLSAVDLPTFPKR